MKRLLFIAIALLLFLSESKAQTKASVGFRNAELKRLATCLALPLDSLPEGYCHSKAKGYNITVCTANGEVEHIGLTLFADDMKGANNALLLNFIERYALQLKMPQADRTAALMLRDDDVRFSRGSSATFSTLKPTDTFSYTKQLGRYTCTWRRGEQTVLELSFPADYQLLCGENKIEVDNRLEHDLMHTLVDDTVLVQPDVASLSPVSQQRFFISRGGSYIDNRLCADVYYERLDNKSFRLLSDATFPAESVANMMLCTAAPGSYTLNIEQSLYGYETRKLSVPLKQWIAYCRQSGCQLYYGVEATTGGAVRAMVLAVNNAADYNHLLTFTVPFSVIDNRQGAIETQLYSFVPMHNVRDLFGKYKKTKSKPKTYVK